MAKIEEIRVLAKWVLMGWMVVKRVGSGLMTTTFWSVMYSSDESRRRVETTSSSSSSVKNS